jgi:hypothetical protein
MHAARPVVIRFGSCRFKNTPQPVVGGVTGWTHFHSWHSWHFFIRGIFRLVAFPRPGHSAAVILAIG